MLPAPPNTQNETDGMTVEDKSWLDHTQIYFSDGIHDFGSYLDRSLAKKDQDEERINMSYVRLRFKNEYSYRGYYDSDEKLSLRVDLPYVKNNWNIILETDPEDYNSLESKQRDLPDHTSKAAIDGAIGGVRLQDEKLRNWETNLDVGVKIKLPLDPFTRGELRRVDQLSTEWTNELKQSVFYYDSLGVGALTSWNLYHSFDTEQRRVFKAGSSAQYLYEEDNWELLFQAQYFQRIYENHLIEYSTGITIEPNRHDEVANSWGSVGWRQKLYSHWLYLNIVSQLDAPREFDYKLNPGVRLELELFFSKNRKWDRLNRNVPESTREKK